MMKIKRRHFSFVFSILMAILVCVLAVPVIQAISGAAGAGKDAKLDESLYPTDGKPVPEYAAGEVLVKFKEGVNLSAARSITASLSLDEERYYHAVSWVKGHVYMHLKSKMKTTQQMVQELQKQPDVEDVSPNYRIHIDATTPNDPRFNELWGLHNTGSGGGTLDVDIDAPEAWDVNTGSGNVIVAVIDTGIDYNHPDLAANIWVNPNEIVDGSDNDGNGFIDDIHGINAITGSGNPMDDNGHGTHCAGTIGAVGNNGEGVVGVNWNVKIIGAKFLDASGSGLTSDSVTCINYLIDLKTNYGQNIAAINASYGGSGYSQTAKDAIDAAGDAGIVFCAAAGNSGLNNDTYPHYPSSYTSSNIIAVTAVDSDGDQWYNYGPTSVDIGAPGRSILSTLNCGYSPQPGDIFFDDMESGAGNWVTGGTNNTWVITTDQEGFANPSFPVPSPPNFWSDSPGANYAASTDSWLMNASNIDLSGYVGQNVYLGFGSAMYIENYYDHAYVEVSGDGGGAWTRLMDFSGFGYYWQTGYSYLIPDAFKTTQFRFRFHLVTDESVEYWGWLIDDVGIGTDFTCGHGYQNGTSMATPHVTGTVALVADQYPTDMIAKRISRILGNTVYFGSLSWKCTTGGMLNLDRALTISPAITVITPNGGENLELSTAHYIIWSTQAFYGNVKIMLLKDGVLVGNIANEINGKLGYYLWSAGQYDGGTAAPGSGYTIKIKGKKMILSDVSDAPFTLSPFLRVTSPNGGESWKSGSTQNITWDAQGVAGLLKIFLFKDGTVVGTIAKNLDPLSGSYPWTVGQYEGGTAAPGTGYTIKIKEMGVLFSDFSDAPFTICSLTVTSPNGGENWKAGSTQNITWDAQEVTGNLKIFLWKDAALVGTIAKDIDPSSGSYPWIVGQHEGGNVSVGTGYTIKIKVMGVHFSDFSDAPFNITGITVTSPNGGENWQIGSTQNITWNTQGVSGNLKIYLYKDGALVGTIAKNIAPAPGSYSWTAGQYIGGTASAGTGYTIKIKEMGVTVGDFSDNPFTLSN